MFNACRIPIILLTALILVMLTGCENTENLRKGAHLINTGSYKDAITHLKAFLEEYPETEKRKAVEEAIAEAYFKWSDNEKQLKHWEQGVELMQIILDEYYDTRVAEQVQDTLPEFLLEWSQQLAISGQFLDSLDVLKRLIRHFPASGYAEKGRDLRSDIGIIAFTHNENIYVMNADGSKIRKVAEKAISPVISPDGKKLAYIVIQKSGNKTGYLTLSEIDGRKVKRLLDNPIASDPVFSPDGSNILISKGDAFQVVDLTGKSINAYFGNRDFDTIGTFNPTGQKIVTFLKNAKRGVSRLCITENFEEYLELHTTQDNPIRDAAWSRDDLRIVFVTANGLHSISPEGGEVSNLLVSSEQDNMDIKAVDISPNGANIIFLGKKAGDPNYKLYTMTLAREIVELPYQAPEGMDTPPIPTGDVVSWGYGFLRY
ncbi:PD40 domain-containing protein [bacterium]|nr:PD40 domain-containing protein [candidate division CSSED10-310 bacterium]